MLDDTAKVHGIPSNKLRYLAYRKLAKTLRGYWERGVCRPFPVCCERAIKDWAASPGDKHQHFRLQRSGVQRSIGE